MKTFVAVLASTFLMSSAYAQNPPPAASPVSASTTSANAMSKGDIKRDERVEKQIKELHAKLKITTEEESQWATVARAMRDSTAELDQAIDKRQTMVHEATAVANLNSYGDIAQAHADGVKRLSVAFAPLYAAMPDEQKKLADHVFAHREHDEKKNR